MSETASRVAGVNLDFLHDVSSLMGTVHAAVADLHRAHAEGEDLGELLDEAVSLTSLVSESLRGMAGAGRQTRPFDLRAAAYCARVWQRNLAVGALTRQTRIDAEAGALTDFVIGLTLALGADSSTVVIREDARGGLCFEPALALASVAREAVAALEARAATLAVSLEADGGSVRVFGRAS